MTDTVAVPARLLLLVAVLALWALWDHALGPAWRRFMSRTADQVIDELSTRLRIGIRPWQRTRRQALIDRLITDPKVEAAAEQFLASDSPLAVDEQIVEHGQRRPLVIGNERTQRRVSHGHTLNGRVDA